MAAEEEDLGLLVPPIMTYYPSMDIDRNEVNRLLARRNGNLMWIATLRGLLQEYENDPQNLFVNNQRGKDREIRRIRYHLEKATKRQNLPRDVVEESNRSGTMGTLERLRINNPRIPDPIISNIKDFLGRPPPRGRGLSYKGKKHGFIRNISRMAKGL